MFVELMLQINSNYSLNTILECALWQRFLQKIDCANFYELQLSLCSDNPFGIW